MSVTDDRTEEDILTEAERLRRDDPHRFSKWKTLARHLGVTVGWLRQRLDPEYAERQRRMRARHYARYHAGRTSEFIGDTQDRGKKKTLKPVKRVPAEDHRDLTGQIMGDPKPGQSALDRKRRKASLAQEAKEFEEARK